MAACSIPPSAGNRFSALSRSRARLCAGLGGHYRKRGRSCTGGRAAASMARRCRAHHKQRFHGYVLVSAFGTASFLAFSGALRMSPSPDGMSRPSSESGSSSTGLDTGRNSRPRVLAAPRGLRHDRAGLASMLGVIFALAGALSSPMPDRPGFSFRNSFSLGLGCCCPCHCRRGERSTAGRGQRFRHYWLHADGDGRAGGEDMSHLLSNAGSLCRSRWRCSLSSSRRQSAFALLWRPRRAPVI